jgi:hypothetical protein
MLKYSLVATLAIAYYASVIGTTNNAGAAAEFPPGTYVSQDLSVTFDGKGHFQLSQGGTFKVSGEYVVKGDEIDLTDKNGPWTCPKGTRTGSYHWQTTDTGLAFTKIEDTCDGRSSPMTASAWKHKDAV